MGLVFRRKVGEKFRIGNEIVVTVIECTSGAARLHISAPAELKILRCELEETPADGQSGDAAA